MDEMHKATSLHSAKIKQMVSQYKHDMQQVEQLTAEATPYYQIAQELYMQYEVKRGLRDLWRSAGTLCGTAVPFEGTFVRVLLFIIPCFSYFVNYDEVLQQIHGECCVRRRISAADASLDRKAAL